jgi:hypothetical protein
MRTSARIKSEIKRMNPQRLPSGRVATHWTSGQDVMTSPIGIAEDCCIGERSTCIAAVVQEISAQVCSEGKVGGGAGPKVGVPRLTSTWGKGSI